MKKQRKPELLRLSAHILTVDQPTPKNGYVFSEEVVRSIMKQLKQRFDEKLPSFVVDSIPSEAKVPLNDMIGYVKGAKLTKEGELYFTIEIDCSLPKGKAAASDLVNKHLEGRAHYTMMGVGSIISYSDGRHYVQDDYQLLCTSIKQ